MPLGELGVRSFDTRLLIAARALLLLAGVLVAAAAPGQDALVPVLLSLGLLALIASVPPTSTGVAWVLALGEAVLAAAIISLPPSGGGIAFVAYLIAPALAAGIRLGSLAAVAVVVASGAVWFPLAMLGSAQPGDGAVALQALLMALLMGIFGGYARKLRQDAGTASSLDLARYEDAYRLLTELRGLSRQLSTGLHPTAIAESIVEAAEQAVPDARAGVLARSAGTEPVHLAGYDPGDVLEGRDLDALAEAWSRHGPLRMAIDGATDDAADELAVLPLRVGTRTVGLLVVTAPTLGEGAAYAALRRVAEEGGLRLETALLFDEVRGVATAEERKRVAREIHDGIAQDIASLGYLVDDLAEDAGPELAERLNALRDEVGRVVEELRLSIFDLRAETTSSAGLGAALSELTRAVGSGAGILVHLMLDESPPRLPAAVEAEVLRIAQEAITNARKHARPENLWVTLRVASPEVWLEVGDDGPGMRPGRGDSFGLKIMSERAARIGATLSVADRPGGGTVVTLRRTGGAAGQGEAFGGHASSDHRRSRAHP